jgi:hypothetical protein
MKPSAYISDGGVIFKESPPDSILKLNPLYTSSEIQALHNLIKEQAKKIDKLQFRELTYEEISDIRDKYLAPKECDIYTFAKAILKAASE